jgi:hypothetical protein
VKAKEMCRISIYCNEKHKISVTLPMGITGINIPNSVTHIGDRVFWGNKFAKSITIPPTVTRLGDNAFDWETIGTVVLGANLRFGDDTYRSFLATTYIQGGRKAGTYVFSEATYNSPPKWTRK